MRGRPLFECESFLIYGTQKFLNVSKSGSSVVSEIRKINMRNLNQLNTHTNPLVFSLLGKTDETVCLQRVHLLNLPSSLFMK